jgi:toxin FitB
MGQDLGRGEAPGRPRPANDSWIAACCLAHQFPLATFNVKDFEDFAEHDGLQLVST